MRFGTRYGELTLNDFNERTKDIVFFRALPALMN
jgi:hypothetical protein